MCAQSNHKTSINTAHPVDSDAPCCCTIHIKPDCRCTPDHLFKVLDSLFIMLQGLMSRCTAQEGFGILGIQLHCTLCILQGSLRIPQLQVDCCPAAKQRVPGNMLLSLRCMNLVMLSCYYCQSVCSLSCADDVINELNMLHHNQVGLCTFNLGLLWFTYFKHTNIQSRLTELSNIY